MSTTLTTDKTTYAPGDTITATFHTDAALTQSLTVAGALTTPDGTKLPASTTVTIGSVFELDPVDGYTVHADPAHPGVFTLTPDA